MNRHTIILMVTLFLLIPSMIFAEKTINIDSNESLILIDKLLSLSNKPIEIQDQLKRYKVWRSVFEKYHNKESFTINETKIYLFMIFIADEKVLTHTSEDIEFDIVKKFKKQPTYFLNVIKELPFLARSTFMAINGHFTIINKPEKKIEFINNYKSIINKQLGSTLGAECLSLIKK